MVIGNVVVSSLLPAAQYSVKKAPWGQPRLVNEAKQGQGTCVPSYPGHLLFCNFMEAISLKVSVLKKCLRTTRLLWNSIVQWLRLVLELENRGLSSWSR